MAIVKQFRMHLRAQHGSTYGYDLVDQETGAVVGHLSRFISRSRKHRSADVYTLGAQEFATAGEFLQSYEQKKIQAQRDAEWEATDPKNQQP